MSGGFHVICTQSRQIWTLMSGIWTSWCMWDYLHPWRYLWQYLSCMSSDLEITPSLVSKMSVPSNICYDIFPYIHGHAACAKHFRLCVKTNHWNLSYGRITNILSNFFQFLFFSVLASIHDYRYRKYMENTAEPWKFHKNMKYFTTSVVNIPEDKTCKLFH